MSGESGRSVPSLQRALITWGVPLENHAFVRAAMSTLGVIRYEVMTGYIKVVRVDGSPDLHIAGGYTNGFASREEALAAAQGGAVDHSSRFDGAWYIEHPANSIRDGGEIGGRDSDRDYGTCPRCFVAFSASGSCMCD